MKKIGVGAVSICIFSDCPGMSLALGIANINVNLLLTHNFGHTHCVNCFLNLFTGDIHIFKKCVFFISKILMAALCLCKYFRFSVRHLGEE